MAKEQKRKEKPTKNDTWVKCQSKSHPGRSYMFNKATGETKWCSSNGESTETPIDDNSNLNKLTIAKLKSKTPAQDRLKRLQHRLRTTESNNNKESAKNHEISSTSTKHRQSKNPTILKNKNSITYASSIENTTLDTIIDKKLSKAGSNDDNSTSSQPKCKTDHKVKEDDAANDVISKSLRQKRKRVASSTVTNKDVFVKLPKIALNDASKSTLDALEENFNSPSTNDKQTEFKKISYSDKKLPINRANTRLENLRYALQVQHSNTNTEKISIKDSECNNDDCESMDWQPISEPQTVNSAKSCETISSSGPSTMGECYDVVNANLMRLFADKKSHNKTWLTDKLYVIVDTNVLLEYLVFISELADMKLCDTNGTIIYVPYCVLQELDKLKMRSSSEGVKTLAVRAIKYLNTNIETHNKNVQAQSAIEEQKHIIHITSPDDSIINCCLQVKDHVDNSIFLTEDVNLRNKAISNDIFVSTKSDLISRSKLS